MQAAGSGCVCVTDLLGSQERASKLNQLYLKVFVSYSFNFLLSSFRIVL